MTQEVALTVVGIRHYFSNKVKDFSDFFAHFPIGATVYIRKEPEIAKYPGSLSVWDENGQQIGNISDIEKQDIEHEIKKGQMLPVTVSGHSEKDKCMYVTAVNTRGINEPEIKSIELLPGETVFPKTDDDEKLHILTSLMIAKINSLKNGKDSNTETLMKTATEYVKYCCDSLDGETTFGRGIILQGLRILMAKSPELESIHNEIFEKKKDIVRKNDDFRTKTFLTQYERIKESALKKENGDRSQMDDYIKGLRFVNGGKITDEIMDTEILKLSSLLATEMDNKYEKYSQSPAEFATALYYSYYSMDAYYTLLTRRIKLEWLLSVRENGLPQESAPSKQTVQTDVKYYPPITEAQLTFFKSSLSLKKDSLQPLSRDESIEWIMHTIYDLTEEWSPAESTSVHKWRILYEVLLFKIYFKVEKAPRYSDFVKAIVKYRFPDVTNSYNNNISKSKMNKDNDKWSEQDRTQFRLLKKALTFDM